MAAILSVGSSLGYRRSGLPAGIETSSTARSQPWESRSFNAAETEVAGPTTSKPACLR